MTPFGGLERSALPEGAPGRLPAALGAGGRRTRRLPGMSTRGLAGSLALSLGTAVFGAAATFLIVAVVGRLLGASGTGVFFQFVAMCTIGMTLLKFGADTGLVRKSAQLKVLGQVDEVPRLIGIAVIPMLLVAAVLGGIVIAAAPSLARLLTDDPALVDQAGSLIRYLTPLVVSGAVMYLLLGAVRGLGSIIGYAGIQNIGLPLARLLGVFAVLAAGGSAAAAVLAWAATIPLWCAATGLLLFLVVRRVRSESRRDPGPQGRGDGTSTDPTAVGMRDFWSFSLGRWAAATVEITLDWADVLLVGALLGPAAAGTYAVATRVVRAGQIVDNAMRVVVGPNISARLVVGDLDGVNSLFRTASRAMLVLTLPFYVTCFVFADSILALFGPGFDEGAAALRVLSVGMTIIAATVMSASIVLMAGRGHWQLQNKLVALAIVVVGNLVLDPRWGIVGAAASWSLAFAVDAILVTRQRRRIAGSAPAPGAILRPLLVVGGGVAAVGVAVRLLLGSTTTAVGVHLAIVGAAYLVGLWIAIRVFRFGAGGAATGSTESIPEGRIEGAP